MSYLATLLPDRIATRKEVIPMHYYRAVLYLCLAIVEIIQYLATV